MVGLTYDEALVLFDWLTSNTEDGRLDPLLTEPADWVAVHRLLGRLEDSELPIFEPGYKAIVEGARSRLRAPAPTD